MDHFITPNGSFSTPNGSLITEKRTFQNIRIFYKFSIMFYCEFCSKDFKTKWQLDRHYNRKIPCEKRSISTADKSTNCSYHCKFCFEAYSRKDKLNTHIKTCKDKEDVVRYLELQLDIEPKIPKIKNQCRFCDKVFSQKTNHTRHLKTCQSKQDYKQKLESKMKTSKSRSIINNTVNNQINVNISSNIINQFGHETTEHITNSYLKRIISDLELSLPKVVSTVAKKIYCDDDIPQNRTIMITNIRSPWAKTSTGDGYELVPVNETVDGVRNKVTDLYIERQSDEPEYFDNVSKRIETLDEINNQNFVAQSSHEKDEQKQSAKLKLDIEREIKSSIYNLQKTSLLSS